MVILLLILTIILFFTVDYVIQRRREGSLASESLSTTLPLSRIFRMMPRGIFLQPSFTWSKILDSGDLAIGIQPVLIGLIGAPDEVVLAEPGENMPEGNVLLTLRKGNKSLQVRSPVSGTVEFVNPQIGKDTTPLDVSRNWLYILKSVDVAAEVPRWLIEKRAEQWIKEKYRQIRNFFIQLAPDTQVGATLADGGDIPLGILDKFDNTVWQHFEEKFLL